MNGKTNTRAALVVASLAVVIGVAPTAAAGTVKPKLWCPQQAQPCSGSGATTRVEPLFVAPRAQPSRTADRRGNDVWRAGSWLMY